MDKTIFQLIGAAVALVAIVSNVTSHSKEWFSAAIEAVRAAGPHYGNTMAYAVFHVAFSVFVVLSTLAFLVLFFAIIFVAGFTLSVFSIAVTHIREDNTNVLRVSLALLVAAIGIGGVFWFILVSPWQSGGAALVGIGLITLICYWPSRFLGIPS